MFSLHMVPARSCTSSSMCPAHHNRDCHSHMLDPLPPLSSQPLLSFPLLFVSPPRLLDSPITEALTCELDVSTSHIDALTSLSASNVTGCIQYECIHVQLYVAWCACHASMLHDGVFRCACHTPCCVMVLRDDVVSVRAMHPCILMV